MNETTPKRRTKPKGNHRLNARLKMLLAILPKHRWNVSQAAIEVGYKESYALTRLPRLLEKNVFFCQELEKRKAEVVEKIDYNVEKWFEESTEALADAQKANDRPVIAQHLKMRGLHAGAFEKDNRQRTDALQILLR